MNGATGGSTAAGGSGGTGAAGRGAGGAGPGGAGGAPTGAGGSATAGTGGPGGAGGMVTGGAPGTGGAAGSGGTSGTGGTAVTGGAGGAPGTGGTGDAGLPPTGGAGPAAGPGVLMRNYDLKRTGATLNETQLKPANVTATGFGKHYCKMVDGEIYGQILYLPGFDFGGTRGRKNAILVVTMKNRVYMLDADDQNAMPFWEKNYGNPVPVRDLSPLTCVPYNDISRWAGILSTPAVDMATQTVFYVSRQLQGNAQVHRLYAQSLVDGSDRAGSPVTISGMVQGNGEGSNMGTLRFLPTVHNQRAGLLVHDGLVWIAFAAHCDMPPYHGWLMGYDARTLQQQVVFNTTPDGHAGGIWMSGTPPTIDDQGFMYLTTGNGDADMGASGGRNHGERFLKLRRQGGTMQVIDWFTPYSYEFLEAADRDLGSAGVLAIPGTNLIFSGGKEGKAYLLNTNDMGKFTNPTRPYQRPTMESPEVLPLGTDRVVQTLDVAASSNPGLAHNHSTPVYWKSAAGEFVYTWAEEDYLRQYRLENGRLTLFKMSQVKAPDEGRGGQGMMPSYRYTMPGGTMALSAAGDRDGIVWVTMPVNKSANNAVVPGVMRAFDASDVSRELWNSQTNATRDQVTNYAKFNPVTVYNGKVYVPTFRSPEATNQYCVYGTMPP